MTIQAYPLQWPTGWPRRHEKHRLQARFKKPGSSSGSGDSYRYTAQRKITISEGTQRLLAELSTMGVQRDDVVISSMLRLRLDGLPRADQGEPADPGVAVYWQDQLDGHKVMAIDIYNRVADNLAAVAATLDAMRAIERHGGAAILDRAFTGFTALPPPIVAGMKRPWREVLQCGSGVVTQDEVKLNYRTLASEHHPDRGGDPEKMAELNRAREEALKELTP